ncbi:FAD-dependent oxidoreductase [Streptosporangium sp. CA-115845]|uniref:FAD-dependent oxidoreductase n=1 Tax=Streptosporangium sp. CA-115845 TaxID=3240071 RepID=UPI003D8A5400
MPGELRVAVVGSGPSGLYVVDGLSRHGEVRTDVFERLPCPYGLLRYGVAPDHFKIKALTAVMARVLERPGVRFFGSVEVGRDVTVAELRQHYDAVVYATGAPCDRRLGVPGEDLHGSIAAGRLVSWYSGHPDADGSAMALDASTVAVFGMGNVALDVARMLTRSVEDLRATDVPDHVLEALAASRIRDVHVIGRRGPLQARFSTKELREIAELGQTDLVVRPEELVADDEASAGPEPLRNLELFRQWSLQPPSGRPRRIHFRFGWQPVGMLGSRSVRGVRLRRSSHTGPDGRAAAEAVLDARLAIRAVGYRGTALPDVPFDDVRGVIPHVEGRVRRDGAHSPGEYVVGWIKRGPNGVIGTNKADAQETVATLLGDRESLPVAPIRDDDAISRLLAGRSVPVTWGHWKSIDAAEIELGRRRGAARVKIASWDELLAGARHTPNPTVA